MLIYILRLRQSSQKDGKPTNQLFKVWGVQILQHMHAMVVCVCVYACGRALHDQNHLELKMFPWEVVVQGKLVTDIIGVPQALAFVLTSAHYSILATLTLVHTTIAKGNIDTCNDKMT